MKRCKDQGRRRRVWNATAAAISLAASLAARGDTFDWVSLSGGAFSDPANWTTGGTGKPPPVAGDVAEFDIGGDFTVRFAVDAASDQLLIQSGDIIFAPADRNDRVYSLTTGTADAAILGGSLQVGNAEAMSLSIGDALIVRNSRMTINANSRVTAARLLLADLSSEDGIIEVMGKDASLSITAPGSRTIGLNGGTGTLRFGDGSFGNIVGTTQLGLSGLPQSRGEIFVTGGSELNIGSLVVGGGSAADATGLIEVSGAGSRLEQEQSAGLSVGGNGAGPGLIRVIDGGTLSTGRGLLAVKETGSISVISGSMLELTGDAHVTGGDVAFGSSSTFAWAPGRTMLIEDGGAVRMLQQDLQLSASTVDIVGDGSRLTSSGGALTLAGGSEISVSDGGELRWEQFRIGRGTAGVVNIDGASSFLSTVNTVTSYIGDDGALGRLNLSDNAMAGFYDLKVGHGSSQPGGRGEVFVTSSAELHVQDLDVGNSTGTTGLISVDGSNSLVVVNGWMTVGNVGSPAESAVVRLTNAGSLFQVGGGFSQFTILSSGLVDVEEGNLIIPGLLAVHGGTLRQSQDGLIVLSSNASVTITEGGLFDAFDFTTPQNSSVRIDTGGALETRTLRVQGGATVLAEESGSSISASGSAFVGSVDDGTLTLDSGATMDVALSASVAGSSDLIGTLNVLRGSTMTANSLLVGVGVRSTGTTHISGEGSLVSATSASIGNFGEVGSARLEVLHGGTFRVAGGSTVLRRTGVIHLDGGTAELGDLNFQGGAIEFVAGALEVSNGLVIGSDGPLGNGLTLTAAHELTVGGTLEVEPFRILTLDGGILIVDALDVAGTFDFKRGTLKFAGDVSVGPAGPLGGLVRLGSGQRLMAGGAVHIEPGAQILLAGGEVPGGTVNNQGLLTGSGHLGAGLNNLAGGEVAPDAGQTLRFTAVNNTNAGEIGLNQGSVRFSGMLANQSGGAIIGRGALHVNGGLHNDGDMALSNGVTDIHGDVVNNAGGRIIVSGQADVTFWDDVQNSAPASSFKVSDGSSATFFGTYSGNGISGEGETFFEADVTPGFSPGTAGFGGDVTFAKTARYVAELAGVTPGSEHDQVRVANHAALAGTLDVDLLEGFVPAPTDRFTVMTAGSRSGIFDDLADAVIAPGQAFSLHYSADGSVSLLAGEWNEAMLEGIVDVPEALVIDGDFRWDSLLVKIGPGELVLDLDEDFSSGEGAGLVVVEGVVRLRSSDGGRTLVLHSLRFGDLGTLADTSALGLDLAGVSGWTASVTPTQVPEPVGLIWAAVPALLCRRARRG